MFRRRANSYFQTQRNPLWAALVLSAVVVGVIGSPALVGAATGVGARLEIGKTNSVSASTTLTATTSNPAFQLKNLGTGAGLAITVKPGKAPLTVNADAGKATNLNADKLDGKDGSEYQAKFSNIQDLNGVDCEWGKILAEGPEDLLRCVSDAADSNNSADQAIPLIGTQPFYGVVGTGDDDWYLAVSGCFEGMCHFRFETYGAGVKFDAYRNDTKVATGVTSYAVDEVYGGDAPAFHARVFSNVALPYAIRLH